MAPNRIISLRIVIAASVGAIALAFMINGCSSTFPNRNPTGEPFPTVVAKTLEKERVDLPADVAGKPAVMLIGYKQSAQFDIDRWLMGLIQAEVSVPIYEIPTIPGLVPSFASKWIDDGMRSGIPIEDWGAVITVYGDAAQPIAALTGNENGRLARVLVLDADGVILWFDDKGYSAAKALRVAEFVNDVGGL